MNIYKQIIYFLFKVYATVAVVLFTGGFYLACESYHNDTIFIQIWVKRSEVNELKNCKLGTHVRVERPNDEYYILPCSAIKELR